MSKKDKVAAIGGFTFPAMVRQVEGFLLGARYSKPEIQLNRSYINTFDDAVKAKVAAQAQIDSGVDVIVLAQLIKQRGGFSWRPRTPERTPLLITLISQR